jgi:SMODS and SLOG-associating 2TM effector domain 3/SMODS and SLOG-associating 2TM effector domain 1
MQAEHTVASTPVPNIDLPAIFEVADGVSVKGQQQTKRRIIAQLVALNLAAACSVFSLKISAGAVTLDWTGLVAAVAFVVVLFIQISRNTHKPEQAWYDGRAVAESVKSLAWKYAVGSRPFALGDANAPNVDRLFIGRLQDIVRQMDDPHSSMALRDEDQQISASMRALRAQPLGIRKETYLKGRVQDQGAWYSSKAKWNQHRIASSNLILIAVAVIGTFTGLTRAMGLSPLDFLGLAATVMVTIFTLLRLNQHETLARAYHIATMELTTIRQNLDSVQSEEDWSGFVAEAEEAISREHTLWLASYSTTLQFS